MTTTMPIEIMQITAKTVTLKGVHTATLPWADLRAAAEQHDPALRAAYHAALEQASRLAGERGILPGGVLPLFPTPAQRHTHRRQVRAREHNPWGAVTQRPSPLTAPFWMRIAELPPGGWPETEQAWHQLHEKLGHETDPTLAAILAWAWAEGHSIHPERLLQAKIEAV